MAAWIEKRGKDNLDKTTWGRTAVARLPCHDSRDRTGRPEHDSKDRKEGIGDRETRVLGLDS